MAFIVENPAEIVKLKEYQALPSLAACLPPSNPLSECFIHGEEGRIDNGSLRCLPKGCPDIHSAPSRLLTVGPEATPIEASS